MHEIPHANPIFISTTDRPDHDRWIRSSYMRSILTHQLHENCDGMHWRKVSIHSSTLWRNKEMACTPASVILSRPDLFISPGAPRGFPSSVSVHSRCHPCVPFCPQSDFFFLSCDVLLGRGDRFKRIMSMHFSVCPAYNLNGTTVQSLEKPPLRLRIPATARSPNCVVAPGDAFRQNF